MAKAFAACWVYSYYWFIELSADHDTQKLLTRSLNYGFVIESFEKVYLGAITSQVPNPYPDVAQGIRSTPFLLIYQNMENFIKASKLYQRVVIFYID